MRQACREICVAETETGDNTRSKRCRHIHIIINTYYTVIDQTVIGVIYVSLTLAKVIIMSIHAVIK